MRHINSETLPELAAEASFLVTYYRSSKIHSFCSELNAKISMLHPDVLALLYHFGSCANGPVLEFGPFVGGSTIAIARGMLDANRSTRVTSVEVGGAYPHPTYASDNIVGDLRRNLARYKVESIVDLVVGHSRDAAVVERVTELARDQLYCCVMIDSDGQAREDLMLYRNLLHPRAYLFVDDYFAPGAPEKEATTRAELDVLEQEGVLDCLGVYGWGTWIGRFR
jgi:predicted O-methyltransferase YrrM